MVAVAVVVDDLAVRRGGQPVQHAALLQVPGMRLGQRVEAPRLPLHHADDGGIPSRGKTVVEVALQRQHVLAGAVPGLDVVVAEEMMLGSLGQGNHLEAVLIFHSVPSIVSGPSELPLEPCHASPYLGVGQEDQIIVAKESQDFVQSARRHDSSRCQFVYYP